MVIVSSVVYFILLLCAIKDISVTSLNKRLLSTVNVSEYVLSKYDIIKFQSETDKFTPEYTNIVNEMRNIRNNMDGVRFIYTAKKVGDKVYYIIDCEENDEERAKIGEEYDDAAVNLKKIFDSTEDKTFVEPNYTTDKYGTFLSTYNPVFKNGKVEYVIGADIKIEDVQHFLYSYKLKFSIIFGLLTLIISPIAYWFFVQMRKNLTEIKNQIIKIRDLEFEDKHNIDTYITDIMEIIDIADKAKHTLETALKNVQSESLLIETCLISKADKFGRITYANDKFCKISGYTLQELVGSDHRIVNSGYHDKEYWANMYNVVTEKKTWHGTVTNKNKMGELYYVKTWIKGMFDKKGEFVGYISVRQDVTEIIKSQQEITKQNTYLEHAAKIIRHDMHSGINTYIPRGLSSLERRLNPEVIKTLKLEAPIKMLKEGLSHTQRVYRGVYEFTNLVKPNAKLELKEYDLKRILKDYLSLTAYSNQVLIEDLGIHNVNEALFCTAIDNLIRNGLRYNDSPTKIVKIYKEENIIIVEDNGRGMSQQDFDHLSQPYVRKEGQKEQGSGLGLNICVQILKEHKFSISCEKINQGTKLKIKL